VSPRTSSIACFLRRGSPLWAQTALWALIQKAREMVSAALPFFEDQWALVNPGGCAVLKFFDCLFDLPILVEIVDTEPKTRLMDL
jgi:hypothetical protein